MKKITSIITIILFLILISNVFKISQKPLNINSFDTVLGKINHQQPYENGIELQNETKFYYLKIEPYNKLAKIVAKSTYAKIWFDLEEKDLNEIEIKQLELDGKIVMKFNIWYGIKNQIIYSAICLILIIIFISIYFKLKDKERSQDDDEIKNIENDEELNNEEDE